VVAADTATVVDIFNAEKVFVAIVVVAVNVVAAASGAAVVAVVVDVFGLEKVIVDIDVVAVNVVVAATAVVTVNVVVASATATVVDIFNVGK
jgi:hypothetical protein